MATTQDTLTELVRQCREISIIDSCGSLLGWDERTYMPRKGAEHRAEQLAFLAGLSHSRLVDPRIGDLINTLRTSGSTNGGDDDASVMAREVGRIYDREVKIPQALVEEITRVTTLAQGKWAEARANSDFKAFKPWLQKVIDLKKQEAEAVGYKDDAYNAMLDTYEPGATVGSIEKIFTPLRNDLVKLLDKIRGSGRSPNVGIITREYPVERQQQFGTEAAAAIGFDFTEGRLDITTHPFCSGIGPGDVRITTRYDAHHFPCAFFGILHEAGHGIYDQGLDPKHFGTPMGEMISLGIHESQSRMWENLVGRSRPFWTHFFPKAQKTFPEALGNVKADEFYWAINDVRPSLIRVEADEATYNLHILLRFEMERAFFSGGLSVDDIPGAWNEKFKSYFGLTPPNDKEGCLQDVHWSAGYIGYFPTYALGNLFAAQFFAKAQQDIPNMDAQFAKGDFSALKSWLRQNIHRHGRRYRSNILVERVTGQPLSSKPLIDYMTRKYGELYGF
ncbi:MAG: carboxypeptidase M32 [candidate division Zixibacteria bacterium]|nr:carboxypeptidase M32 [candidate division Zixibacteria bacterium]